MYRMHYRVPHTGEHGFILRETREELEDARSMVDIIDHAEPYHIDERGFPNGSIFTIVDTDSDYEREILSQGGVR